MGPTGEGTTRDWTVLVVGDEDRRKALGEALADRFAVTTVAGTDAALEHLDAESTVGCVVTAGRLPDGTGPELANAVAERRPDLPIVVVPSQPDGELAARAAAAGIDGYLPAPLPEDADALVERVATALDTYRRRRKQAEDSDMFTSMLDSLPVAIYVKDREARHLRLSDVPGGPDPQEAIGKTDYEIHEHDISRQSYEDDLDVIETGEPVEQKPEMHATQGIPAWLETTKVPWRDDDGTVKGVIGFTYDITHLKERERQLRRRIHRLERFADFVAHDVRTPLGVAQGNVELARVRIEDGDREGALESLSKAADAVDRMDELVEDLHGMADTGDLENEDRDEREPIGLRNLVTDVFERMDTQAAELRNEVPAAAQLYAVESHLYPFFENLFKNAVEHGSTNAQGDAVKADEGVTITVGLTNTGFAVADDGPGIPPEERALVTQPGYSSDADEDSGTGLNIVADIAYAHGWTIEVDESDAGGARFSFDNCLLVGDPTPEWTSAGRLALESSADVGDVAEPGYATETDGDWTVAGAGDDLWRDTNEFHIAYRTVTEPVRITATVADVEHVDDYSKAGLMVRDELTEDATFGYVGTTPAEGSEVLWRTDPTANSVSQQFDPDGARPPYRLVFDGAGVTAFVDVDGEWLAIDQRTIDTDGEVAVGLAVCSVTPRYLCEATFADVTVERLADR